MVDLFRCFHSKIEKHEKCLTGRRKWKPLAYSNTSCWLNESFSEKLDGLHQFVDTGIELLNQKENFFNHLMYSFTFNFLKAKKFFLQFLRFKDSFYLNIVDPISSTIILKILDKIWLVQVVFPNSRLLFRLITPIFLKRRKHYMATIFNSVDCMALYELHNLFNRLNWYFCNMKYVSRTFRIYIKGIHYTS